VLILHPTGEIRVPRLRAALTGAAVVYILALSLVTVPPAIAQTQYVVATPGFVNLGMVTSVIVTAPAAGSYGVTVVQPNGTQSTLSFAPSSAGQVLNATYGNATMGFKGVVDQTGTYNVFLEQGGQVVSSTSFYATNKFTVSMDMVDGGTCAYIPSATRGTKMFPRFYIYYASDGAPLTNTVLGAHVTYTLPDGSKANATWDSGVHLFVGKLQPNWNYTSVGPWSPNATIRDGAGNIATFQYAGTPYDISPVELSTSIVVVNSTSGQQVTSLSSGEGVTIEATITYPASAEPVKGFVGPLDSTARGGSVAAQVGWGYYNVTSGTFGGKTPGGLLGTVPMTYSGSNGTWKGQFESGSLQKLQPGVSYEVVVSSKDAASPPNTGFAIASLSPAASQSTVVTQTTTSVSVSTQSVTQTVESIPTVVYAALVILLIIGVLVGYIVRIPR